MKSNTREIVAGGPEDFMTVVGLELSGKPHDIGVALAGEAREFYGWAPPLAGDRVRNRARRRWFEKNWPAHHGRMEGVAAHFGRTVEDDAYDFSTVMAEPFDAQCSAVWDGTGRAVGRNLDFSTRTLSEMLGVDPQPGEPPALSRNYLIGTTTTTSHAVVGMATGDLTGLLDGINEHGLCVSLLSDDESPVKLPSNQPQAGLYEMHLSRFVLETCSSAEEALEALHTAKQYDEWAVAHFLVADATSAFVWERELHNVERAIWAEGGRLCVANHLLTREPLGTESATDSYRRGAVLESGGGTLRELLEAVRADARGDERYPLGRVRTIWHAEFTLATALVTYEWYLGDREDGSPRRSQPVRRRCGSANS